MAAISASCSHRVVQLRVYKQPRAPGYPVSGSLRRRTTTNSGKGCASSLGTRYICICGNRVIDDAHGRGAYPLWTPVGARNRCSSSSPQPNGGQSLLSFVVISRYLPTYLLLLSSSILGKPFWRTRFNRKFQLQNSNTLTENIRFERLHHKEKYAHRHIQVLAHPATRVFTEITNVTDSKEHWRAVSVGYVTH